MMRIYSAILLMFVAIASFAQARLGFEGESHALVGIYVKDLSSDKVIASNNPEVAMAPASVMKSITAASALSVLGPEYTFSTPVYLYGKPDADDPSTWRGNLVVESCGDPTIDSKSFKSQPTLWREISRGLDRLGIRRITGKVIVEQSLPDAGCIPSWEVEDVAWPYGAGLYGFNFRDNVFNLWPATLRTEPFQPGLEVVVCESEDGTDLIRGVDSNKLSVWGRDPRNEKWSVECSMPDPAAAYQYLLNENLKSKGIEVMGRDIDDDSARSLVCLHSSPLCADILRETLVVSHNLFAEAMLRAIADGASRSEALKAESDALQAMGVSVRYNQILDGSGLSRADRLQPKFISDVLQAMSKTKYASQYVSLFPKAGVEGTVAGLLSKTRLKGQLAFKSGSMGAVQCFAGYKLDANGKPTHTVVILVNAFYCPRSSVRASIEKFLLDTFK
ncbi:MAG: D-alanyl-D-alanine carboxypeptidase/D-alanyl-D-alanine-endopeptidase [Clostridium sp.]|nr:D-alanyl-D-alanine carboxypeptidase/D-alanyl-D-alanine-endopeptidase [Clostridium sp.]